VFALLIWTALFLWKNACGLFSAVVQHKAISESPARTELSTHGEDTNM
jgi:hypothetical protein